MRLRQLWGAIAGVLVVGCVPRPAETIIITATFPPPPGAVLTAPTLTAVAGVFATPEAAISTMVPVSVSPPSAAITSSTAVPTPARAVQPYIVQPGDTLSGIAAANEVSLAALLAINQLANPNNLIVGQTLNIPPPPTDEGSALRLLPDRRLVRSVEAAAFDTAAFIAGQPGFLKTAIDLVEGQLLTGPQIVERVALEYSVDPRLLLAAIEFQSRWLSDPTPAETNRVTPLNAPPFRSGADRAGLYHQLTWAANQLNAGYYGWKTRGLSTLEFTDGNRVRIPTALNAATVGVQWWLSRTVDQATWMQQVSANGFIATYAALFGDPYADGEEPLIPAGLVQPELTLPFPRGQTWYYTGGPHGGYGSGSAWGAIDFAPPDDITQVDSACYVSEFFATAVAPGVIARTAVGTVILDLDGDGNEATGWTILYLHIDETDRVTAGTIVETGDPIGRPSCEGGFSTATHMHIARRYNGEWLPADCGQCRPDAPDDQPVFNLSGWFVYGVPGREYQGSLLRAGERLTAEQGRAVISNQVSW